MTTLRPAVPNNPAERGQTPEYLADLDRFETQPAAVRLRQRTYQLIAAAPGSAVIDVGCGAGRAVAELCELDVAAVGVDINEGMLGLARSRYPGGDFRVAAAHDLPFEDGVLHGWRADKVLHEVVDPVAALVEARRVLVPGGRIVVAGQDWDLMGVDGSDVGLTRALVHARADTLPAGLVARQLPGLLTELGFRKVAVEAHTAAITQLDLAEPFLLSFAGAGVAAGIATQERADRWLQEQRERGETGRLLLIVPILVTAAVRASAETDETHAGR